MSRGAAGPIRVLHVDDDPDVADVAADFLEALDDRFDVETATSARTGLSLLDDDGGFDCVVSDHDMPEMDGLEFLRAVREVHEDLPFILFTGKGSEEIASEAISAGVTEYLEKGGGTDQYEVLAHRIERAVAERRARAALWESERMFSTLVENLPGVVYRCRVEPGWPMTYVSPGCEEMTGYPAEALESGEVVWGEDVIHPDDQERVWEPVERALEAGESFEVTYRILTADGTQRWAWERGSPVVEDGEAAYLEGFITDITEQREREAALRAERNFAEEALNALDDAFFVIDHETGEFRRWNDRVTEMTGYTDEELEGMTAFDTVVDEDEDAILESMDRRLEGNRDPLEVTTLTKDGDRVPVEIRGAPLYDPEGGVLGIAGIGRDVTERTEREQRLEEFASVVSHDLRNPLHVIVGHVELAREVEDDAAHLDRIGAAADRMDELIEDLLSLARRGEVVGETEPVEVAAVARAAWETVAGTSAALQLESPGTVEADRDRLQEVFENLFRNAVEHAATDTQPLTLDEALGTEFDPGATGDGVPVRIRVGATDEGFFVSDDGPGIPEAERDAVFQHGYSTTEGGTGLGLSIVQRIATGHGWDVSVVESELGGARFEFAT